MSQRPITESQRFTASMYVMERMRGADPRDIQDALGALALDEVAAEVLRDMYTENSACEGVPA